MTCEYDYAWHAQVIVEPRCVVIPILENKTCISPARTQIAKAILPLISRARIPLLGLRPVAADQSGLAQNRQLPVLVSARILNLFQTLIADFCCDLTRMLLFLD